MRKPLLVAATIVVLLAACGKSKQTSVNLGVPSATPASSSAAKPGATPSAAKASSTPATTKSSGGSSSSSTTAKATAKPAAPGSANAPKDGTYTYRADGSVTQNGSKPQTYNNQTITAKNTHSGTTYTSTESTSQGTTTSKDQWTSTGVKLLSISIQNPAGTFSCTYNPPLQIIKFPIKPETYPQQKLSGSGNACGGTLDIQVVKQENASDASGHSWSTWLVHVKTVSNIKTQYGNATISMDEMRNFSPDLGVEIKSVADDTQNSALGKGTSHVTTVLKSHP
jgi:hypothetical protein